MKLTKPLLLLSLSLLVGACDSQPTPSPGAAAPVDGTEPAAAPASTSMDEDAPTPASAELTIEQWGPEKTKVGKPFNVQADGKSGMWFKLSSVPPPAEYAGTIGGKPMTSVVANGNIVAGTVPPEYLSTPGTYPVVLTITTTGQVFEVGNFVVE